MSKTIPPLRPGVNPAPYDIDPDTDFYTAGLLFNKLEAEYQRARAGAGQ